MSDPMQNTQSLLKDVRGCMTQVNPLTPEIVAAQTDDGLTYDELKVVLGQCRMDIEKMVFRSYQNAFFTDCEQVFSVWSHLHAHIDYANGMLKPEVLDYVCLHAPQTELPEPDESTAQFHHTTRHPNK